MGYGEVRAVGGVCCRPVSGVGRRGSGEPLELFFVNNGSPLLLGEKIESEAYFSPKLK